MKPIILTEFTPARGHQLLFENTYRLLSLNFEVHCIPAFISDNIPSQGTHLLPVGYFPNKGSYIKNIFHTIKNTNRNIKYVFEYAESHNIETIICLTYDDFGLFFSQYLLKKKMNVYLMHHANIDALKRSSLKRLFFHTYCKKVRHIVQCEFLSEYFSQIIPEIDDIIIWPHPLNQINKTALSNAIYDCVGLSTSNDDSVICEIIENEKNHETLKNNGLKVILKSNNYEFDNGYLRVIKGFIEQDLFENYVINSRSLLMPFPETFKMRMSGTLMDALSNKKHLIGTEIPIVLRSKKTYPEIVHLYTLESFASLLKKIAKSDKVESQFNEFITFHSDTHLSKLMYDSITLNRPNICNYDF